MLKHSLPFLASLTSTWQNKNEGRSRCAVQLKSDRIREEAQAENQQFLDSIDEGMKKVIKEQVKSEVSKITPKIEVMSDVQRQLYKALVDAYEADKILLDTYGNTVTIKRPRDGADDDQEPFPGTDRGSKRRRSGKEPVSTSAPREKTTTITGKNTAEFFEAPTQLEEEVHLLPDWFQQPKRLSSPDHAWNKSVCADHEYVQPWLSNLARRQDPRESFDELTDITFDFSAFVLNRLNVTTLTPELLAGPTFELMKGTCKSLTELEYFCEEVYKATTEKLDWINPEGRQYPHDLRKPLLLVPNPQGRHVMPFHHFINNDLEYLRGGESSRRESHIVARSKDNSMHLRPQGNQLVTDDDILYKFKEGDFHRLRIQDIEDMLLLLVQGKLTNLNMKETSCHFNVSLRMFHKKLLSSKACWKSFNGLKAIQKKLNLTSLDTTDPDLRRRDFSDGTLDDVRTALNDRLKGIRMDTPQIFGANVTSNARAMKSKAIDKNKRQGEQRSLEIFVGGRPYGVTYGCFKGPYDLSYVVLIL
ncbi:hypothetical protein Tco_0497597 [Tanacetum coccineum]